MNSNNSYCDYDDDYVRDVLHEYFTQSQNSMKTNDSSVSIEQNEIENILQTHLNRLSDCNRVIEDTQQLLDQLIRNKAKIMESFQNQCTHNYTKTYVKINPITSMIDCNKKFTRCNYCGHEICLS